MKKLIGIVLCAVLLAALPAMARQADTAADIGMEEAQRIALEHAGILDPETAFVLKCEKDWEDGRTVYEVEFVVDAKEYDYDIDASTGEVVAFDGDARVISPWKARSPSPRPWISPWTRRASPGTRCR